MLLSLGDGGLALAHVAAVAADAADTVLPALAVAAAARLALVDELAELGAPVLALRLVRRQRRHHVVAVRQQQPDQSDCQRREARRDEPFFCLTGRLSLAWNAFFDLLTLAPSYPLFKETIFLFFVPGELRGKTVRGRKDSFSLTCSRRVMRRCGELRELH